MDQNSDFLVVGAGINGLLVARELLADGASVTLLDKGEAARESSWAGGGIVSPLYPWRYSAAVTALANWAQAFYPRLAQELKVETGIDAEFNACGLLMLDAPDQQEALLWAQAQNREMLPWPAATIYDHEDSLAAGFKQGLWMPNVGNVRNPRLCRALLASLQQQPRFRLFTNAHVDELVAENNSVCSVKVRNKANEVSRQLEAGAVVLTAGAWSQLLLDKLSVKTDIEPVKGQMLLYKFDQPPIQSIVLFEGKYLIPRQDGHVLVGSTLEYAGFDKTTTDVAKQSLQDAAAKIMPAISGMEPVAQWSGLRPASEGGVPYIGMLEPYSNLFINAGQFRNGLVLAPASARLAADLALGRQASIDPAPYAPAAHFAHKNHRASIRGLAS